jgi:cytochrome c553
MTGLVRHIIVLVALIITAALALSRLFGRGAVPMVAERRSEHRAAGAVRGKIKRWAFPIAAFLFAAASGGFLIVISGIMPIKASSGHWPITVWFLNFAMGRSIATHSLGIETPPLDDHALVLKGAGHYEIGCRPCHGSPDLSQQPRIAQWMTPRPPNLSRQIPHWDAAELFTIVKHGVKFTGMPAWPAQKRDDEVWAVVAFLLKLPAITAAEYKRLVRGVPARGGAPMRDLAGAEPVPPLVTESCGRCHGLDGRGRGVAAFPKLTGQKPAYFMASMQAYALGRRSSGIMEPIAIALSQEVTAELARYYAGLEINAAAGRGETDAGIDEAEAKTALSTAAASDIENTRPPEASPRNQLDRDGISLDKSAPAIERGREIAMRGIPKQRVPACGDCHGPSDFPRNANYPTLAGQYADYLVLQLTLFKKEARGGTAYAHLMRPAAAGLTAEQMRDVASYYESLAFDAERRK